MIFTVSQMLKNCLLQKVFIVKQNGMTYFFTEEMERTNISVRREHIMTREQYQQREFFASKIFL